MESRREEVDKLIMHLDTNILSQELIDETYSQFCNIVKEEMECTYSSQNKTKKPETSLP